MDPEPVQHTNTFRNEQREEVGMNLLWRRISYSMPHAGCCLSDKAHRYRYLINFLAIILGMGTCVGLNGFAAQLPLLVIWTPEGSTLPAKMAIAVVLAYIASAIYAITYKSSASSKIGDEFNWLSSILVIGTIAMGFLAFFYDVRTTIDGVDYSVVMLVIVFILSSVTGSRNIFLLPYLQYFKEVNLSSLFIGEGLSGLIPSIVALMQGVGGDPVCPINVTNSTDPPVPYISPPNFSTRAFMLFLFALMASCTCALWLLQYMRVRTSSKTKDTKFRHDSMSDEDRDSSGKLLSHVCAKETHEIETTATADMTQTNCASTPGYSVSNSYRIYLCVMMWLVCLLSGGFLTTMETYSSRPYGNSAYHLVVNLSQLAATLVYVLTFWLPPVGARGITMTMGLLYVGSSYVTWLALRSPTPPWRDTTYGVVLLISIWVFSMSLTSYAKLAITAVVWQETSQVSLQQLNVANLIGSSCSAGLVFWLEVRSLVMIILVFLLASLAGSRNVLLMPYLRHFADARLTSFFICEGLGGFVPSIVALIQGVGGDPVCPSNTTNSTDALIPDVPQPNFSARVYFLFVSALLFSSTCAFWLLEYLRVQTASERKNSKFRYDRDSVGQRAPSRKLLDNKLTEKNAKLKSWMLQT